MVAALLASPPFVLPSPTGPMSIGSLFWMTTVRGRPVAVNAFYPSTTFSGGLAPYLRYTSRNDVKAFATAIHGPLDEYEALADVQPHAQLDAPPLPGKAPLLVFSHGYTAVPSAYTALLEDLASHGFIVLSVFHPYEPGETERVRAEWKAEDETMSAVTKTSDEITQLRLTRAYLAALPETTKVVERWAEDIRAALAFVPEPLAGHVDWSRVGVFGHSMGGVASAQFCLDDARCKAGLNLDGIPQYGALIDGQLQRPFLMVYSARPGRAGASDIVYARAATPYYRVDVRDTLHLDFTDMVFWPMLRERHFVGPLPAARAVALTRAIVFEYFEQELNGRPSALLAGTRREPEVTVARFPRNLR